MLSEGDLGLLCELRRRIPPELVERIVEPFGAENSSDLACLPLLELTEDLNFGNFQAAPYEPKGGPGAGMRRETRWTVFDPNQDETSLERMEESLQQSRDILGETDYDPFVHNHLGEAYKNIKKKTVRIKAAREYADVKKKLLQTKEAAQQALPCKLHRGGPAGSIGYELNNDLVKDYHKILRSTMADLPHISDPDAFKMHGPPTLFSFNAKGIYPPVLYQTLPLLGRHFRGLRRNYGNYRGAREHGDRLAPAIDILLRYFPNHLKYVQEDWDNTWGDVHKPPKAGDLEERALVYDRVYEAIQSQTDHDGIVDMIYSSSEAPPSAA